MSTGASASLVQRLRRAAGSSLLLFPLAALLNSFSMTALLLVFGLAGAAETAADIGLVQAATLALFYAFSANGRNLVLGEGGERVGAQLLKARVMLVLPLALAGWLLSVRVGDAGGLLASVLILRRASEWMGEIGLALHERDHAPTAAGQYLLGELLTLGVAAGGPLLAGAPLEACAFPWALAPLLSLRGARVHAAEPGRLNLRELLPHFGSTAAVGVSTYVFRISIAILAGKALAGELFTAFAIGGLLPTLFGQGLAPTLAHRYRDRRLPSWLLLLALAVVAGAIGVAVLLVMNPALVTWTRHTPQFWVAGTLSVGGGAVMGAALMLRTRLIQDMKGGQVYGPDLMANLLIATCVPFVFYLLGPKALGGLYLLSAMLNAVFYWRASHVADRGPKAQGRLLVAIAVLLVLPVFVQLSGGLFADKAMVFDPAGAIGRLPLPVSVAGVFLGIALLGNYASAVRTLTTVFFTAALFIVSSLIAAGGVQAQEGAKLILLAQFLLPMFGLILGEMYGANSRQPWFERGAAVVLLFVLPAQLLATWWAGKTVAQPHVFFFSIYQHLQYFPMLVVALTVMAGMALFGLSRRWKVAVIALWLLALLHSAASVSITSTVGAVAGLVLFIAWHGRQRAGRRMIAATAVAAVVLFGMYAVLTNSGLLSQWMAKPGIGTPDEMRWSHKMNAVTSSVPVSPAGTRSAIWLEYAKGSTSSLPVFLFGHAAPPDRKLFPSAHNYWLDALYNFGVLALMPLLALLAATVRMAWQRRHALATDPALVGCLFAMVYLVLVENMLKVGMRQPYPGLLTLFVWGLLVSRLRSHPVVGPDGGAPGAPMTA